MVKKSGKTERFLRMSDRRSKPRIRTGKRRSLDRRASCRLVGKSTVIVKDKELNDRGMTGNLLNVSDRGICVELDKEPKPCNISLNINLSPYYEKEITGDIRWIHVNEERDKLICGIEFMGLTEQDKKNLRKRFLLNENFLLSFARDIIDKTSGPESKERIRNFFLKEIRQGLMNFIEIDNEVNVKGTNPVAQRKCNKVVDRLLEVGNALEQTLQDNAVAKEIKHRLRALVGPFVYNGIIVKRGLEKPRGYPGDYQMLEYIYDNVEASEGIGKYFDRYFLENTYACAVRNRKDKMCSILKKYINSYTGEDINILNLACGACREIRELTGLRSDFMGKVKLALVDHDEEALNYAIEKLEMKRKLPVDFNFIKGNILELEEVDTGFGNDIDLIYSIGITDYLPDRMLVKFIKDCFERMKVGGTLVISHKDKDRYTPLPPNWFCDWYFVPRNEKELISLIKGVFGKNKFDIEVEWEKSGIIFFLTITKLAD
jgi:SAM-dependent methyltransferase